MATPNQAFTRCRRRQPPGFAAGSVLRLYPKTVLKPAVRTMLVTVPRISRGGQPRGDTAIGGQSLRDTELLTWCGEVIRSVLADPPAA
jgi:hypothetical protein